MLGAGNSYTVISNGVWKCVCHRDLIDTLLTNLLACWFTDIFEKNTGTPVQTKSISNHRTC